MKRWLPYPAMSGFILAVWLVLNQSLAAGDILLGALFGIVLAAVFQRIEPPLLRLRKHHLLFVLFFRVVWDILRSNLMVLRIIVTGRPITSGFVSIPLQLDDRYGLAVLACIITSTPGTIWVSYESKERTLLIHVFDLVDEAAWVRLVTERYERPLREVFG